MNAINVHDKLCTCYAVTPAVTQLHYYASVLFNKRLFPPLIIHHVHGMIMIMGDIPNDV